MGRLFLIPRLDFDLGWLRGRLRPGDQVMALKMAEFVRLRDFLPRVTVPEEWISYAGMKRLAQRAYEINRDFASESCGGGLIEGYDLPGICIHMQDFFFRDILLAEALAGALKRGEWEKIIWVGNPRPEPSLVIPTTNVVASTFRASLGESWEVLKPPTREIRDFLVRLCGKVQNALGAVKKKTILIGEGPPPRCGVVAVFPPTGEWERFSDALEEIQRGWRGGLQVWSVGPVPQGMQEWANRRGVRAVWVPYPDGVRKETAAFFRTQWDRWSSEGRHRFGEREGCPVLSSDQLAYHFDFYFNGVWPRMAEYCRVLEKYLGAAKPQVLIGSSGLAAAQLFAYPVARRMGIPSIALPHGSVQMGDSLIPSDFLACRNRFERHTFIRSFPQESRVLYCRNAANELSYQPSGGAPPLEEGRKAVLILSCEVEVDQTLMPYADRVAVVDSFRELKNVPQDLRDLEFWIKSHPRWNLAEIFRSLGLQGPGVHVLDSSLSLLPLVEKAWVVVMFNHFGSAVLHAIGAEKPVLFLNSGDLFWPCTEWRSFAAGEVVKDMGGLWNLLRRLKKERDKYEELRGKCRKFKTENLSPAENGWGEIWEGLKNRRPAPAVPRGEMILPGAPMPSLPIPPTDLREEAG